MRVCVSVRVVSARPIAVFPKFPKAKLFNLLSPGDGHYLSIHELNFILCVEHTACGCH